MTSRKILPWSQVTTKGGLLCRMGGCSLVHSKAVTLPLLHLGTAANCSLQQHWPRFVLSRTKLKEHSSLLSGTRMNADDDSFIGTR